jgi:hypothetical protein
MDILHRIFGESCVGQIDISEGAQQKYVEKSWPGGEMYSLIVL